MKKNLFLIAVATAVITACSSDVEETIVARDHPAATSPSAEAPSLQLDLAPAQASVAAILRPAATSPSEAPSIGRTMPP